MTGVSGDHGRPLGPACDRQSVSHQITFYRSAHFLCLFLIGWGLSTARTASSNTCLRPLCVSAEHSRYFTARILFASFWPCSRFIGECPFSARACSASLSSLKSIFVPAGQVVNIAWFAIEHCIVVNNMLLFLNTALGKLADVLTFSAVTISFANIQKLEHLNLKIYSRTK